MTSDLLTVPVIMGLVWVAGKTGVPSRFLPITSVAVGAAAGLVVGYGNDLSQSVITGILLGLAASGAYDNITVPQREA